ncbi:unnamed protein product (macronuclear) [Paramecium tetraurelia]|uniref:Uncharacterized protein n=1 Tax=Paramecium tetraurelia TaxID=5888 RepID=A0C4Z0_PARTE|nr:uncharacterized protein GSPATT00006356001 [Paramecium tetraurelia]CAK65857.1 unnamed protein product [Paramecium tetraurelia]|eukprot:XP_001433254.1 hypothetical protein (macronuclear) [Paramecium tetraurelia strain d4-2]
MLINNTTVNQKFKVSNNENRNTQESYFKQDKENYYNQWELKLKQRETQLEQKYKELKNFSRKLKIKSDELVQQKLELGEKIEKYNRLLEQIIQAQMSERQVSRNASLTPNNNIIKTNKIGINECQQRVANLLQKIRHTSKTNLKTQQYSYLGNNSDYEEILFSKRQNHSTSLTGIMNISAQDQINYQQQQQQQKQNEIQQQEGINQKSCLLCCENELMNHEQQLQQMETSQRQFYSKVYEEMNKLRQQL